MAKPYEYQSPDERRLTDADMAFAEYVNYLSRHNRKLRSDYSEARDHFKAGYQKGRDNG